MTVRPLNEIRPLVSLGATTDGLLTDASWSPPSLAAADALGRIHSVGPFWGLLGYRRRFIPDNAALHASVQSRIDADPSYRSRIKGPTHFVDEHWDSPMPKATHS